MSNSVNLELLSALIKVRSELFIILIGRMAPKDADQYPEILIADEAIKNAKDSLTPMEIDK